MSQNPTSIESRALVLLGCGTTPEQVAAALGVTAGRISQLLAEPDFATQVTQLRFDSLQKHNARDTEYDVLEDQLLVKMRDLLPMMYQPMQILKAIAVINAAKRRGHAAPEQVHTTQTVVQINIPTKIIKQFITTNIHNQVIATGEQDLVTIQPKSLLAQLNERPKHIGETLAIGK